MLQPANRLTLIDAMRPPAGFSFESAMAVTYTLDLRALLAAPAALALTGSGHPDDTGTDDTTGKTGRGRTRYESIELIHALRAHAGRMTVFSQVGEIALAPSRRAFAFLERTVLPVSAPRGGIVHPKVWVIRYETAGDPADRQAVEQRLRVLIASRNLTFDASWDTMVRLDETTGPGGTTLRPVGELFTALLSRCAVDVPADHLVRVQSLATALQDALFALPAGVDDLKVHVLGLEPKPSPLPSAAERSLIISPFVSDTFFTGAHPSRIDELVSSPEWLDRLEKDSLARVGKAHAFDDGSATDIDSQGDKRSPFDPGRPLVGLHAKVFAFEDEGRARLFLGSANATGAAFKNNVEILVELTGPIDVLGIDRLCQGSDDEPGLRDLFYEYRRSCIDDGPSGEPPIDGWRQVIARLPVEGRVTGSSDGWAVTYRTTEPIPETNDVTIHCWPLTVAGNRRQVAPGRPLEERFETSLENLSGFLAFELTHTDGELSRFVVPVPLSGVPEQRDRALLKSLIGSAERFFRYLMALLEEDAGESSVINAVERMSGGDQEEGDGPVSLPVLERLLRTMRREPGKLAELHPLVSDLADDDALPPGFAELWEMIHQVATTDGPAQ